MGSFAENERLATQKLEQNAREVRQGQEKLGAEWAHEIELELRACSPEVQAFNDKAEFEIWGSTGAPVLGQYESPKTLVARKTIKGERIRGIHESSTQGSLSKITWLDPETGQKLPETAGKLAEMRTSRRYGRTERERNDKADQYLDKLLGLQEHEGLELCQAKLIMDLRDSDYVKITELTAKFMQEGVGAQEAEDRAQAIYDKRDCQRRDLIKDEGIFSREEYDRVLASKNGRLGRMAVSKATTDGPKPRTKPVEPARRPMPGPKPAPEEPKAAESEPVSLARETPKAKRPPKSEPKTAETERSGELAVQLDVGERSEKAEYHEENEDTLLRDDEQRLFGVFDGMGGYANGAVASQKVAEAIKRHYLHTEAPATVEDAIERAIGAVKMGRIAVITKGRGGDSVGVFAKVEEIDGKPYLVWANVGDSRLFIQHEHGGEITAISTDQSSGNEVYNSFAQPGVEDNERDEFGYVELKPGARIMFCSDGITGDWENQFLTDAEMQLGFNAPSAQAAADKFLEVSKKEDDKSVIVIDVLSGEEKGEPKPDGAEAGEAAEVIEPYRTPDFRQDNEIFFETRDEQGRLRTYSIASQMVNGTDKIWAFEEDEPTPEITVGKPVIFQGTTNDGKPSREDTAPVVRRWTVPKNPKTSKEPAIPKALDAKKTGDKLLAGGFDDSDTTTARGWRQNLRTKMASAREKLAFAKHAKKFAKEHRLATASPVIGAVILGLLALGSSTESDNHAPQGIEQQQQDHDKAKQAPKTDPGKKPSPVDTTPSISYDKKGSATLTLTPEQIKLLTK